MSKKLGLVFFIITLLGVFGFLTWSGYIYIQLYHQRQNELVSEIEKLQMVLEAIGSEFVDDEVVLPALKDFMKANPSVRFLSLGQENKIRLLLARQGIKVPNELQQREFPGFSPIPFFHHYHLFTITPNNQQVQIAVWKDPIWTFEELNQWLYPGILFGITLILGIIFLIIQFSLQKPKEPKISPSESDLSAKSIESPQSESTTIGTKASNSLAQTSNTLSLYDPHGFVWFEFLKDRLDTELNRSTAENQELCFVMFEVVGKTPWQTRAKELVMEFVPYKDYVFGTKKGFAIILPRMHFESVFEQVKKFIRELSLSVKDLKIKAGLSARSGRIISSQTLIEETETALSKAGYSIDQVVGFKADPELYRQYLKSQAP